jgi:hypothetical protein
MKALDRRFPERALSRRSRYRLKLYGLTMEQYAALEASHAGRCAICGRDEKLVIDHCHATGKVRGLLCQRCNKAIGLFLEDCSSMEAAVRYLRGTSE